MVAKNSENGDDWLPAFCDVFVGRLRKFAVVEEKG